MIVSPPTAPDVVTINIVVGNIVCIVYSIVPRAIAKFSSVLERFAGRAVVYGNRAEYICEYRENMVLEPFFFLNNVMDIQ